MGGSFQPAEKSEAVSVSGLGWRHLQVLLMFVALTAAIAIRTCLSMAIVGMTSEEGFNWGPIEKSLVLGSFLWGYTFTQVAGGWISSRGNATRFITAALIVSGILTAGLPVLAKAGGESSWLTACVSRALTGFVQGLMFPTMYTMMGRWAPPLERARCSSIVLASQPTGSIIANSLSGVVAAAWGWEAIFYLFGVLSVVMGFLFLLLSFDHPLVHPRISAAEREYITESISTVTHDKEHLPVPWMAMMRSVPLWALLVAHNAYVWGYWVCLTCIPSFCQQVLGFNTTTNGLISALPYVAMLILACAFGWLADFTESREWMSLSWNRKLFNTIGSWGPALMLILLAVLQPTSTEVAVMLLVLAVGLISATFSGTLVNMVDLTPNFSGVAFAISNTSGSLIGILAPFSEGVFVDKENPLPGWKNVFFLTAGVWISCNLVWVIFGTAEEQPWNNPHKPPRSRKHSTASKNAHINPALDMAWDSAKVCSDP